MEDKYYVYVVKYRGIIVYIGHGCGDRINHVSSGTSSSRQLNELYFRKVHLNDEPVTCEKVNTNLTKQKAMKIEESLIRKHNPLCNTFGKSKKHVKTFMYSEDIEKCAGDMGLCTAFDSFSFTENSLLALTGVGLPIYTAFPEKFDNSVFDLTVVDGGHRIMLKPFILERLIEINPEIIRYCHQFIGGRLGFSENILHIPTMLPVYLKEASSFFAIENVFNSQFDDFVYRKFHTSKEYTFVRYAVYYAGKYAVLNATEDKIELVLSTEDREMARKTVRSCQDRWRTKTKEVLWEKS